MRALLRWITNYLPCRIISDGDTPYLERYYLFTVLGWRFYLHQFVGSDPDRGLHCHPWRLAFSIILAGWYYEETAYGTRKVRWFNWLTGESKHRVVLPPDFMRSYRGTPKPGASFPLPKPCWTLFFHRAKNEKTWGFYEQLSNGGMIFRPYTYTREGNQKDWWLTAPKGRAMRAAGKAV